LAYTDGDEFALQMDKATILGDAVTYVRELQGKVKTLEKDSVHVHGTGGTIQSTVLVKKPCRIPDNEVAASDGSNGDDLQKLPEIEARLSDQSVLLRIHCDSARGLLVKVLSEVEMMSLVITHTNVMPYPSSTAIITITAKASHRSTLINTRRSLYYILPPEDFCFCCRCLARKT
jgi:hypothetical protein